MDPRIDTVTIGTTEFQRALEFYEHGFGFPVEARHGECVTLKLGGSAALELCPWDALARGAGQSPRSSGFRGVTLSYIVADSNGVDAVLARLVAAGGEVAKEPRFAFWGYSAHVADPSGHLWKIASPKRKPLLGRKRTNDGVPDVVPADELALTIGVADMQRSRRFYEEGLGNPTKKAYSKFVQFDGGDGTPDLSMYNWDALADDADVSPEGSGFRGVAMSHVVDSAEAVDRLLDRARSAGAKLIAPGWFTDPDGYLWKITTRKDTGHAWA